MPTSHLLIKYKNSILCENTNNRLDFINVPPYSNSPSFTNMSVFITLTIHGLIDSNFNATKSFNYYEWGEKFEIFDPDYLYEIEEDTYIYDLDLFFKEYPDEEEIITRYLKQTPSNLVWRNISFLHELSQKSKIDDNNDYLSEEIPYTYHFIVNGEYLSQKLDKWIRFLDLKRSNKDVLLLYSGGKDSTLSAIRLHNAGYNVHFIHFDNGCMRDTDKPFLTFLKTFNPEEGYYFSYVNKKVDVSHLVRNYQSRYNLSDLSNLELDSEYSCLSCRMAMYTETLRYAKNNGFKFIADGARQSQKFMLEQPGFLTYLQALANSYGITLLFPVLDIKNDQEEISEIIDNGYSSKTWESKCLIGKPAIDKTKDEKAELINYFEKKLKPTMKRIIER